MTPTQTDSITHLGTVAEIFEAGVDVAIVSEAACGSCQLKKACGMDESAEKIITVFTPDARFLHVGDRVEVLMRPAMGYRAIVIAYIVPVAVVLAALAVLVRMGLSEIVSAGAAIGFLAVYYFCVYLFRDRIGKSIRFELRIPKNN